MQSLFLTINDPLPVLPGNEQDLCHEHIDPVSTYQVCKVHDIVCFGDQSANVCQKLVSQLNFVTYLTTFW